MRENIIKMKIFENKLSTLKIKYKKNENKSVKYK